MEAGKANTALLQKSNFDFEHFITSQQDTILTPGSEFRSIGTLKKLMGHHQDWDKIRKIILEGCDIPTTDRITAETTQKADLFADQ